MALVMAVSRNAKRVGAKRIEDADHSPETQDQGNGRARACFRPAV